MTGDSLQAPLSKAAVWAGRVISGLIVTFMLFDGVIKVIKIEPVMKACVELGIPEYTIQGIGIVLIVSTILYAIPQTAVLGAILLTGYMGGALQTHVRMGGPVFSVVFGALFGVLIWLGLYLRDRRVRALIPVRGAAGVIG